MADPAAAPVAGTAGQEVGQAGTGATATATVPAPATPASDAAPSTASASQAAGPQRGPDGKFAPKSNKIELPGVLDSTEEARESEDTDTRGQEAAPVEIGPDGVPKTPAPAAGTPPATPAAAPAATPPGEKFVFGGAEFESREKAEQSFATLRGQFRSMDARVRETVSKLDQAVNVGVGWQQYAQQLEARLNGQGAGPTAAPTGTPAKGQGPGSNTPGAAAEEGIDWGFYRDLGAEYGPEVASIWLHEQNTKSVESRVKALVAEAMAPIAPYVEQQKAREEVTKLFEDVAVSTDPVTGQLAYPELHNQAQAEAIMLLLPKLGMTKEQALTPLGVHVAVALYRDAVSRAKAAMPAPAAPAVPSGVAPAAAPGLSPVQISELAAASAAAAAVSSGAQPPVMQPAGANGQSSVASAISGARDLRIGGLGFSYE